MLKKHRDRLLYCQVSDEHNSPSSSQANAMSLVSSRVGDGTHTDFGLFIVAQGAASQAATRIVAAEIVQNYYHVSLMQSDFPSPEDMLRDALGGADTELRVSPEVGTTAMTAAIIVDHQLHLAHVGSSRMYIMTEAVEQITTDQLDASSAIGSGDQLPPLEVLTRPLPLDARLLLCSQGLWDVVSPEAIEATMRLQPGGLEASCDALVDQAKEHSGSNLAVILLKTPAF